MHFQVTLKYVFVTLLELAEQGVGVGQLLLLHLQSEALRRVTNCHHLFASMVWTKCELCLTQTLTVIVGSS